MEKPTYQTMKDFMLDYCRDYSLTEIDAIGSYKLNVDPDNNLSIKRLDFFWNAPPDIKDLGY